MSNEANESEEEESVSWEEWISGLSKAARDALREQKEAAVQAEEKELSRRRILTECKALLRHKLASDGLSDVEINNLLDNQSDDSLLILNALLQGTSKSAVMQKLTVDDRILLVMGRNLDCIHWSMRKWAELLGCSAAAVARTPSWQTIKKMRQMERAERPKPAVVYPKEGTDE